MEAPRPCGTPGLLAGLVPRGAGYAARCWASLLRLVRRESEGCAPAARLLHACRRFRGIVGSKRRAGQPRPRRPLPHQSRRRSHPPQSGHGRGEGRLHRRRTGMRRTSTAPTGLTLGTRRAMRRGGEKRAAVRVFTWLGPLARMGKPDRTALRAAALISALIASLLRVCCAMRTPLLVAALSGH